MTLRIFTRSSDNSTYAIDSGVLSGLRGAHVTSLRNAGYTVTVLNAADLATVIWANGFDPNNLPLGGEQVTLAQRIPVTVQGASEQFITSTMQQVVVNTNTVGSQLSAVGATYRDQLKTHVTAESNRVIAAI